MRKQAETAQFLAVRPTVCWLVLVGRVLVEQTRQGTSQPFAGQSIRWIRNLLAGPRVDSAQSSVQTDADGTFALNGLRGSGFLSVTALPLVVRSVTFGGRDVTGVPIELAGTEQIGNVEIVLTSRTARVRGTVTGVEGAPADAWIVLFPDNPDQWVRFSPRVSFARVGSGAFDVLPVLPGRYLIAAVEAETPPIGRLSLERLRPRATPLVLEEGKTTWVRLTVGR